MHKAQQEKQQGWEKKRKSSKKKAKRGRRRSRRRSSAQGVALRVKSSYPATFCVEIPKTVDGTVPRDERGNPVSKKEHGYYSCHHIAHHECWERHLCKAQQAIVDQLCEEIEGAPVKSGPKRPKKKRK